MSLLCFLPLASLWPRKTKAFSLNLQSLGSSLPIRVAQGYSPVEHKLLGRRVRIHSKVAWNYIQARRSVASSDVEGNANSIQRGSEITKPLKLELVAQSRGGEWRYSIGVLYYLLWVRVKITQPVFQFGGILTEQETHSHESDFPILHTSVMTANTASKTIPPIGIISQIILFRPLTAQLQVLAGQPSAEHPEQIGNQVNIQIFLVCVCVCQLPK